MKEPRHILVCSGGEVVEYPVRAMAEDVTRAEFAPVDRLTIRVLRGEETLWEGRLAEPGDAA